MDRLASCYFCGVAVEAPLEEYPVVPRDLRPSVEDQSTVVLCPDCRRKLSTIVERVVAATTDSAQAELGEAVGSTDDTDDVAEASPMETVERFDEDRPNLVDFDTGRDRDVDALDREADAASGDPTEEPDPDGTETPEPDPEGTDVPEDDPDEEAESGRPSTAGGRERPERGDDGDAVDDEQTDTEEPGGGGDGDASADADRDFSKSAYNKIVRLLQNREFPVEEEEIATVAGSAYGIGRREASAVVEALIDRGILERDGERLRRAED